MRCTPKPCPNTAIVNFLKLPVTAFGGSGMTNAGRKAAGYAASAGAFLNDGGFAQAHLATAAMS